MTHHTERPCAAGLTSYRYGSIMIGATSTRDALVQADRSPDWKSGTP